MLRWWCIEKKPPRYLNKLQGGRIEPVCYAEIGMKKGPEGPCHLFVINGKCCTQRSGRGERASFLLVDDRHGREHEKGDQVGRES